MQSSDDRLRAQPITISIPVSKTVTPEQALNRAVAALVAPGMRSIITEVSIKCLQFPVVPVETTATPRGS